MFISSFARISIPLTALTGKGVPFAWGKETQAAFEELKRQFQKAPMLREWVYGRTTSLDTDCSGYALGGTLCQEDEHGVRYVVAFHSACLSKAEYNYPIHDKELLAIISCVKAWRAEL